MIRAMRGSRGVLALALAGATSLGSKTAHADERAVCARAYEQAQRLPQSGENKRALESAMRCAQPSCPGLLVEECKQWVTQLRQQLSRLEVHVSGSDACPLRDATIEIDRVKQAIDAEILVEPGVHEVRAIDNGGKRVAEQTINVAKNETRVVELGFAPSGALCTGTAYGPPAPSKGIPKVALGLGIAGGALLLTGVVLGVVGALKRSDLDECKPDCSAERIDGARTFFVAGDIIGAVGILTLGAGAAAWLLGGEDVDAPKRSPSAARVRPNLRGVEVRF